MPSITHVLQYGFLAVLLTQTTVAYQESGSIIPRTTTLLQPLKRDDSTTTLTSSATSTLVWATGTDSAGVLQTTQSPYTQLFSIDYSTATAAVPSGTIGLGSQQTGAIGVVREYPKVRVNRKTGEIVWVN